MKFQDIVDEAKTFGIIVKEEMAFGERRVTFTPESQLQPVTWMWNINRRTWEGQSDIPSVTGCMVGRKGQVADWCLDWAANGF